MEAAGASSSSGAAGDGGSDGRRVGVDQLRLGLKKARRERVCTAKERISRMPPCAAGKRSSIYRGVTRHRWTGRYEAHLWDKSTWNQNQNKKGKQVYLGAYDDEEAAARAYDLAALKYWGPGTLINFPVSDYSRDLEEMQMVSKEDYLVSLRRKSSAFSRGFPKYRGVSRQPQNIRWEASQTLGNMYNVSCSINRDATLEEKYAGGFMDRKIDLTSYIRWWIPKKTLVINAEDVDREIRSLECKKIEPYQLPSLGLPYKEKAQSCGLSACSILSRSEVFRNFQEKLAETKDETCNKEVDHGKEALMLSGGGLDTSGVALGLSEMPVQRAPFMFAPVVSGPSRATWDPVDPPDPGYWTNFFQPT